MDTWDDFIKRMEANVETFKRFLEPLENGTLKTGSRPAGGVWQDTTQDMINRERAVIASLERVIAKVKRKRGKVGILWGFEAGQLLRGELAKPRARRGVAL